ncbi:unnamed protein product [Symbiodinium necroappetens]|uniref:Uncharacterized protein n=1 Tax=Symbiodinium necroappetens TaxID=1628268 RepID=A0A812JQN8_9DINO|nr:unnamed protein product [Symbiodinium necroappetens]
MTVPMASYPLQDPDQQQVDAAEASPAPAERVEPFSLHLKLEMLHLRSSDGRRGQPT